MADYNEARGMKVTTQPPTDPSMHDLDAEQLVAVMHRSSNLLILAGAGSGKTRTLTHRTISLLKEMQPENLLVVTFTKKAAKEISERIYDSVTHDLRQSLKRAWIGTFHSICWRILMENGHLVNLAPTWSVLDAPDSERVMRSAAAPFRLDPKEVYRLYSYARNSLTDWHTYIPSQRFPNLGNRLGIERAIESYNRRCRRSNRVDFDDLQVLTLKLMEDCPHVRQSYRERFQAILVDEYQDTNKIQARVLELLAGQDNVTVVGDDAQAIYSFRAATVENILRFPETFSAKVLSVSTNYRSTPQIVTLADESIKHNRRRMPKQLRAVNDAGSLPVLFGGRSPSEEAAFVVSEITALNQSGVKPNEIAVLFRANRLAAQLQIGLRQAGLPYELVGDDFFSLDHVKAVLDTVRLLVNPEDTIALSGLQGLVGFSTAAILETVEQRAEQSQTSVWETAAKMKTLAQGYEEKDYQTLLEFGERLQKFRSTVVDGQPITQTIVEIVRFLTPSLRKKPGVNWTEVQADLEFLVNIAAQFISLGDFANTLALQQFHDKEAQSETQPLVLTTIHSAKGLEWDVVFIIGLVEFWFPLNYAIQESGTDEEERRLFYVAVTRAKRRLYLTHYKQAVNQYGKTFTQAVSRFITELPESVYEESKAGSLASHHTQRNLPPSGSLFVCKACGSSYSMTEAQRQRPNAENWCPECWTEVERMRKEEVGRSASDHTWRYLPPLGSRFICKACGSSYSMTEAHRQRRNAENWCPECSAEVERMRKEEDMIAGHLDERNVSRVFGHGWRKFSVVR